MPERQISWKQGFSLSRKPEKRPTVRRKRRQQIEFVLEQPHASLQYQRRPRSSPTAGVLSQAPRLPDGLPGDSEFPIDTQREHLQCEDVIENEPPLDPSNGTLIDEFWADFEASPGFVEINDTSQPYQNSVNSLGNFPNEISLSVTPGAEEKVTFHSELDGTGSLTPYRSCSPNFTPYMSIMECNTLLERFRPILTRYNAEFCTIPLTLRLRINPFRYRDDLDPEPKFLMHAVMALAGHHLHSPSALSHRHASLHLLRQSLSAYNDAETMYSVLDAIIILFSLDETQSMLGNWSTHLKGAYDLLEACGGIKGIALSSRVEAQIGILTWWDAITSLLSREDCVFPYMYFEAVEANQPKREWDFFGLCGCPTSLAKIVMRVARLGAQMRNKSSPPYSEHCEAAIADVEKSLEDWFHTPAVNGSWDEEGVHRDLDAMHCSEAWRNGILLYIFRVFRWNPGDSVPLHVLYRARTVVDHVVSCRDGDMISRQALLPLFLAGCELRDGSKRKKIVNLCKDWDERTRYHMFRATIPLLEEVWAAQAERGFNNVWWGQVVDRRHLSEDYPIKMRLCFG
ncbi:hypothetical protein V2G26_014587 [Clonostachys chloroleuca]